MESEEPNEGLSLAVEVLRRHVNAEGPAVTAGEVPLAKSVCTELLLRISTTPRAHAALRDVCELLAALSADERTLQVNLKD